jgi:hypothetical protein
VDQVDVGFLALEHLSARPAPFLVTATASRAVSPPAAPAAAAAAHPGCVLRRQPLHGLGLERLAGQPLTFFAIRSTTSFAHVAADFSPTAKPRNSAWFVNFAADLALGKTASSGLDDKLAIDVAELCLIDAP